MKRNNNDSSKIMDTYVFRSVILLNADWLFRGHVASLYDADWLYIIVEHLLDSQWLI